MNEFDEWANLLKETAEVVENDMELLVNRTGNKALRNVKRLTPVGVEDGGVLRRSWAFNKNGKFEGAVINTLHYAPHVEYGHRTRLGIGGKSNNPKYKYKPKPGAIKMVPGRFMLRRSIEGVSKSFFKDVETIIDNLFD